MSDVQVSGFGGCPILVVEDETLIRMMLVDELEDAGFEVVEADNADAAMARLNSNPGIGVVVTDVRMPGTVDGLGLATWMRENRPSVPIIITSGFAAPHEVHSINPAIAGIVPKPYKPQDVVDRLNAILRQSGRAALT